MINTNSIVKTTITKTILLTITTIMTTIIYMMNRVINKLMTQKRIPNFQKLNLNRRDKLNLEGVSPPQTLVNYKRKISVCPQ